MDPSEIKNVYPAPLSWREVFHFSIAGGCVWSIWIGPVLVTIDRYSHEHGIGKLINVAWRPD